MKTFLVIVNTDDCAELLARPERFCSPGRLESCSRIKNPSVRLQGYAAELALSYALSGSKLLPPVYRREETGKPVIDGGFISLSHSGAHAVCALSDCPVGADIEEVREVGSAVARRILSPYEAAEYEKSADENYLLKKFVLKEAYLKLTGDGIAGGFDRVFERDGRVFFDGILKGYSHHLDRSGFVCRLVTQMEGELDIIKL